jgi:hypothetical protein
MRLIGLQPLKKAFAAQRCWRMAKRHRDEFLVAGNRSAEARWGAAPFDF